LLKLIQLPVRHLKVAQTSRMTPSRGFRQFQFSKTQYAPVHHACKE
jgi:hypothetical protein